VCEESGVGAEIDAALIPRARVGKPAREVDLDLALHGGEDYELLFAACPGKRVPSQIAGVALTHIGVITRTPLILCAMALAVAYELEPQRLGAFLMLRPARDYPERSRAGCHSNHYPSSVTLYPGAQNRTKVRKCRPENCSSSQLVALLFTVTAVVVPEKKQPPPPPAHAKSPSPAVTDELIHKQFGDNCSLLPGPPQFVADMDDDGVEDLVVAARCKNPMADRDEYSFVISDPYDAFSATAT
jgi:hypothetical protein